MASGTEDMLFPLPKHQLPRVNIDAHTIAKWKGEAQDAIAGLMVNGDSWFYRFNDADPSYARTFDKNGTRGCMRMLPDTHVMEYIAQAELHTTIRDVVYALSSETTQQQRSLFAQLYQDMCLDTAIVQLYEGATADDPFYRVAMLWVALDPEMTSARDYLHFDFSCTTKDAYDRPVLVNYRETYNLRPDQLIKDHPLQISRQYTHGMTTYCSDRAGRVVMTTMGHIELESKFSGWVLKTMIPSMFKRTLNYHGFVEAKALQQNGFTAETLVDRSSTRASLCHVCHKTFGLTRHRNWCRGCGHAVCRNCNMKIALLRKGVQLGPRLPIVLARFCMRCLLYANEQRMKSEREHTRMMATEQSEEVRWWESINLASGTSIEGLLDLHRDRLAAKDSDVSLDPRFTTATFSTTGSGPDDESELAKASSKADELALVAASVAKNAALLREMHEKHYTRKRTQSGL